MSTDEQLETLIGDSSVKRSSREKILGAKIDSKHNFDDDVKTICIKASNILRALASATLYISIEKKTSSKFVFVCTVQLLFINMDVKQLPQ